MAIRLRFGKPACAPRDYAAEDLAQREADEEAIDGEHDGFMCDACDDDRPHELTECHKISDAEALDRLVAFMNRPGQWNGGDVCELAAELLVATGRQILA